MKISLFLWLILVSYRMPAQFHTIYGNSLPLQVKDKDTDLLEIWRPIEDSLKISLPENIAKKETYLKREGLEDSCFLFLPLKTSPYCTSTFGLRFHPVSGAKKFHNGIDLKANYEGVYAMANGIIKNIGYSPMAGLYITISHGDLESAYCHLSRIDVKPGDIVRGGSTIASSGATGMATGPHLHWVIRYKRQLIDPRLIIPFCKGN